MTRNIFEYMKEENIKRKMQEEETRQKIATEWILDRIR